MCWLKLILNNFRNLSQDQCSYKQLFIILADFFSYSLQSEYRNLRTRFQKFYTEYVTSRMNDGDVFLIECAEIKVEPGVICYHINFNRFS